MFVNQPFHFPHRMCRNGTISGQGDRIQPELALAICTTDVNVRRLDALVRVKVKPKSADSEYRWHPSKVLPLGHVGKFCSGQGGDVSAIPVRQRPLSCPATSALRRIVRHLLAQFRDCRAKPQIGTIATAAECDSDRLVIWKISRSPRAKVASTTAGRHCLLGQQPAGRHRRSLKARRCTSWLSAEPKRCRKETIDMTNVHGWFDTGLAGLAGGWITGVFLGISARGVTALGITIA